MTSEWTPVTSGVPQGSVLGPVLFIIYINDIDLGLNNFISKFADDTKIVNAVLLEGDRRSLQDLRKISDWSVKWEMSFNINKCQILLVYSINIKNDYEMRGVKIKSLHPVKGTLWCNDRTLGSQPREPGFDSRGSGTVWAFFPIPPRPCSPSSE